MSKTIAAALPQRPPTARVGDRTLVVGLVAWFALLGAAFVWLWSYKTTAGAVGPRPSEWPTESTLGRSATLPTLLVFAHPLCDCTKATLAELRVLNDELGERVHTEVVFLLPEGVSAEVWKESAVRKAAAALPGVDLVEDLGGREAERFGARTSGQALLFAVDGRRLFAGGLTEARGHEGDNLGLQDLRALLRGERARTQVTAVFGCPLRDPIGPTSPERVR